MSTLLKFFALVLFAGLGLAAAAGVVWFIAPDAIAELPIAVTLGGASAEANGPQRSMADGLGIQASHQTAFGPEVGAGADTTFQQQKVTPQASLARASIISAPVQVPDELLWPSAVRPVAANQTLNDAAQAVSKALAALKLEDTTDGVRPQQPSQPPLPPGQPESPALSQQLPAQDTPPQASAIAATAVATDVRPANTMPHVSNRALAAEGDGRLDINIPDTDIHEVLQLLSRAGNMNILASKSVTGNVKASLTGVNVETALDAILRSTGYVARRDGDFVYVGTPDDFLAMDHAIDHVATRVYRPNYVTAAELQALITPMLTPTLGSVSVSSAAQVGIGSNSDETGGDNFAGAEVVLVRDYEAVLAQVDQIFAEVDRRPLQVSIEAMILSVKLTDEHSLGVDWELFRDKNNLRLIFGSPLNNLNNIDVATNSGLVFGYLDSNISFLLDALEKVGETHVISSPRLMCLNKQRAEIHIGEERGYVSTTVTETAATQSVEFLEVGTQLRLRPFISNDGLIRLEIHPELSTGTVEVSDNFTLPNKTVTQVTTNVMVRDGATLIIGGLLREDLQSDREQLPLLGSLPIFGPAFRSKTDKTSRDEIVVLITPRIVWEPQFNCEGEYANCEFHQQHAIFGDKMSNLSRVHYGKRYYRLAKAAWAAGNAHAALRYVNMSIHFNSLERAAIRLRSEIIAGSSQGDHTVDSHLKKGLAPWQHPRIHNQLTDWVLDEWHGPHTHLGQQPAPIHDSGESGYSTDVPFPLAPAAGPRTSTPAAGPAPPPHGPLEDVPRELIIPEEG